MKISKTRPTVAPQSLDTQKKSFKKSITAKIYLDENKKFKLSSRDPTAKIYD